MTFNKNAILGVVAALFIGGLGNGIWEYVLEPAFAWSATGILNIATLGIQSFKDDIYSEIAKGFHEESSLSLANTFYYLLGYGVAFGFFLLTRKIKDMLSKISSVNKELGDIEAAVNGNTDVDKSKNDIRMHISKLREQNSRLAPKAKLLHKAAYLMLALGIAFFGWMAIGTAKARYINSAIVHYEQSLAIVTPLTTDKELAVFKSRFARVASKNDYEVLIFDIANVGERGDLEIPNFKVW